MENSPGSIRVVTISMHAEIILQLLTESPNHSLPCYDITHFRDGDIIVKRCWGNNLNELMIITTFMSSKSRALEAAERLVGNGYASNQSQDITRIE